MTIEVKALPLSLSERVLMVRQELEEKMDKGPAFTMTFEEALHMCACLINIEEDIGDLERFTAPIKQQYMESVSSPQVVELKAWKAKTKSERKWRTFNE